MRILLPFLIVSVCICVSGCEYMKIEGRGEMEQLSMFHCEQRLLFGISQRLDRIIDLLEQRETKK